MAGYEISKFVSLPPSIVDEVTCAVCLNVMNEPMCTPCCGHSYCRQCITQALQMSSNPNTCPNDRRKVHTKDLVVSRAVANILDKQEVYCDHKTYGCPQTLPLGHLSQHLSQCWFNPAKAQTKCDQMFDNMYASVDKLKGRLKRQEIEQFREQLSVWHREFNIFMSSKANAAQRVFVQPNTDEFKRKILESAKNNAENAVVIDSNIDVKSLKKKVLKKCKEAVKQCCDYNQLGQYLVDQLNNGEYEWSAFVGPKHAATHSVTNFVDKIEVHIGDLSVLLVSHHSDDVDDDDYETDDDLNGEYFDYSDPLADEDDDDGDEWGDWTRNQY